MKTIFCFVMPWHISERGGGAEVQANYLSIELANRGFLVYYICQTKNTLSVDTETVLNGVNICWLKPSGIFQCIDQNKYYKKLEALKPDIIVQRMSSNVTYTIGMYAKNNKKTLIWVCTDNHCPSRNYFVENLKKKFDLNFKNGLKYLLFFINAIIMDYFRNKGMDLVDIAFTQNQKQENNVKLNFKRNSHRMISGHPHPKFNLNSPKRFSKKTILWAANWGNHKRPELFMEIARELIDSPYRFVMLGGHSDKAYESKLIADCPENIELKGQLSFEEALEYFEYSSILINTSVEEGFSNTYIQSWLRGTVVLSLHHDPNNWMQNHNIGFCAHGDFEAMVRKTQILLDNPVILNEMARKAKIFAEQTFAQQETIHSYLNLFKFI